MLHNILFEFKKILVPFEKVTPFLINGHFVPSLTTGYATDTKLWISLLFFTSVLMYKIDQNYKNELHKNLELTLQQFPNVISYLVYVFIKREQNKEGV